MYARPILSVNFQTRPTDQGLGSRQCHFRKRNVFHRAILQHQHAIARDHHPLRAEIALFIQIGLHANELVLPLGQHAPQRLQFFVHAVQQPIHCLSHSFPCLVSHVLDADRHGGLVPTC